MSSEHPPRKKMNKEERRAAKNLDAFVSTNKGLEQVLATHHSASEEADMAEARAMKARGDSDEAIFDHYSSKKIPAEVAARLMDAVAEMPSSSPNGERVPQADEHIPASQAPDSHTGEAQQELQADASESSELQQQAGKGKSDMPAENEETDPRWTDKRVILTDVRQMLRDRQEGKSDEEITTALAAVGYPEKVIKSRFRAARIIEKEEKERKKRAEKVSAQTPETKKALEILEAAARRKEAPAEHETEVVGKPVELNDETHSAFVQQILRERAAGTADEELGKQMEALGYSREDIDSMFRDANDFAEQRMETAEAAPEIVHREEPAQAPEISQVTADIDARIAHDAAFRHPDDISSLSPEDTANVAIGPSAENAATAPDIAPFASSPEPASSSEEDVDMSGAMNPFMVNEAAQEDYDALKADIHAAEERRKMNAESAEQNDELAELHSLYPGGQIPQSVLEHYARLDKGVKDSIGDEKAEREAMTRLELFMNTQRVAAREGLLSGEAETTEPEEDIRQRKVDEALDAFRASGQMKPMPSAEDASKPTSEPFPTPVSTAEPAPEPAPEPTPVPTIIPGEGKRGDEGVHRKWGAYEDAGYRDMPGMPEGTRKDWQDTLRKLIAEKLGPAKEKADWYKSCEEGLIRRNAELDAQAEKLGGIERTFRGLGERYNKLSFTKKVLIGAGLGVGAIATAGSFAAIFPMLGLAAQRAAGFSTMYLKFEKKWHDEAWGRNKEWGKQKALLSAGLYTVLLGLTMKEAIEYASNTEVGHALQAKTSELAHAMNEKVSAWLGGVLGHGGAPFSDPQVDAMGNPTGQSVPTDSGVAPQPIGQPPHVGVSSSEHPAAGAGLAVPPEAMKIDVAASKGHGYEYMTKRLWEQLQEKHVTLPANANPDSDLAKLLAADKDSIDKVVHQLAQENKFFHADGASAQIDLGSHLTIDKNGNLFIQGTGWSEGGNLAPADADVTPAYHPEAATHAAVPEGIVEKDIAVPEPVGGPFDHPISPIGNESASVSPDTLPPVENHDFVVNAHEVTVPLAEPHIYSDGKSFMAYGGSPKEHGPFILKYLTAHPEATVYGTDEQQKYRIPWKLVEGKLVAGEPEKLRGFLGLGRSFVPPPSPEEFTKIVQ